MTWVVAPTTSTTTGSEPTRGGGRASDHFGTGVGLASYLVLQVVFLVLLRSVSRAFFWIDDQQAQYVPVFRWIGEHLRDGRAPLFDPELGASGNYLADPQYGVLDPAHWLMATVVAHTESLVRATWLLSGGTTVILGAGVFLLARAHRASVELSLGAALALSGSGFFLWFGASWFPLLWSTAWLPWLWLGLSTRHRVGVPCAALAAYLLGAAGYPYNLVVAGLLVLAVLAESWWRYRGARPIGPWWRQPLAHRLLAATGGLVAAVPALLVAQQLAPYTQRVTPESGTGNIGILIPNAVDTLLGGQTLALSLSGTWGGSLIAAPIAAAAVFAVPALALVDWRRAVSERGVLTAVMMTLSACLLTQLPSYVGPFRYPFRFLTVVELFMTVTAVLGIAAAVRLTRRRLLVAGGLVLAQVLLAVSRAPNAWEWHLLALIAGLVAVAALAGLRAGDRRAGLAAGAALLVASIAGPWLGIGSATALARSDQQVREVELTGLPARQLPERPELGTTAKAYRDQLAAPGQAVTVPTWFDYGEREGWAGGVVPGNANLIADMRTGFGYIAAGQRAWTDRWCLDYLSRVQADPECVDGLLTVVPGTDAPWVDVLSADRVLLSPATPSRVRAYFDRNWTRAGDVRTFAVYDRTDPEASRVSFASFGVQLADVGTGDEPAYAGSPMNTYQVSTGDRDGHLVLRVPWWPGLRATLDGEPVRISAVEETALRIDLPAAVSEGRLEVFYEPTGVRLVLPAAVAGVMLAVLAMVGETLFRRPPRTRPDAVR